jgi:hypothetical protein
LKLSNLFFFLFSVLNKYLTKMCQLSIRDIVIINQLSSFTHLPMSSQFMPLGQNRWQTT